MCIRLLIVLFFLMVPTLAPAVSLSLNTDSTLSISTTGGDLTNVKVGSNAVGGSTGDLSFDIVFDLDTGQQGQFTARDALTAKHSSAFDIAVRTTNSTTGSGGAVLLNYTDTTGGGYSPEKPVSDLLIEARNTNGSGWDGALNEIILSDSNQNIVTNNSSGTFTGADSLDVRYTIKQTTDATMPPGQYKAGLIWTILAH